MQREDAVLDGLARDEAVDGHGLDLADAVGAIGGLVLDGGVPPGVEEDDLGGGGEVEAGTAGLQGDEEDVGLAGLETVDLGAALGGGGAAVEVADAEALGLDEGADVADKLGELGEDEDATALLAQLGEELEETVDLGGARRGGVVDEAGGARDLAEAGQRREDAEAELLLGAVVGGQRLEGRDADGLVAAALVGAELDVDAHLGAGREVGRDLGLHAAEQEGPHHAGEGEAALGVAVALDGGGEAPAEGRRGAEEARHDDAEEAPELGEAVLDGCAGEGDAGVRLEGRRRLRALGVGVLHGLGLVEDDGGPGEAAQGLVAHEDVPGGDDEVTPREVGEVLLAGGAVVEVDAQARGEALGLAQPVEADGHGGHDELGAARGAVEEDGEGLDGLAETHVVREHGAAGPGEQAGHPREALELVGAEVGAEGGGQDGGEGRGGAHAVHALGPERRGVHGGALVLEGLDGAGVYLCDATLGVGGVGEGAEALAEALLDAHPHVALGADPGAAGAHGLEERRERDGGARDLERAADAEPVGALADLDTNILAGRVTEVGAAAAPLDGGVGGVAEGGDEGDGGLGVVDAPGPLGLLGEAEARGEGPGGGELVGGVAVDEEVGGALAADEADAGVSRAAEADRRVRAGTHLDAQEGGGAGLDADDRTGLAGAAEDAEVGVDAHGETGGAEVTEEVGHGLAGEHGAAGVEDAGELDRGGQHLGDPHAVGVIDEEAVAAEQEARHRARREHLVAHGEAHGDAAVREVEPDDEGDLGEGARGAGLGVEEPRVADEGAQGDVEEGRVGVAPGERREHVEHDAVDRQHVAARALGGDVGLVQVGRLQGPRLRSLAHEAADLEAAPQVDRPAELALRLLGGARVEQGDGAAPRRHLDALGDLGCERPPGLGEGVARPPQGRDTGATRRRRLLAFARHHRLDGRLQIDPEGRAARRAARGGARHEGEDGVRRDERGREGGVDERRAGAPGLGADRGVEPRGDGGEAWVRHGVGRVGGGLGGDGGGAVDPGHHRLDRLHRRLGAPGGLVPRRPGGEHPPDRPALAVGVAQPVR